MQSYCHRFALEVFSGSEDTVAMSSNRGLVAIDAKSDISWPLLAQTVLEQGGSFAGINRKVQLKPVRWAPPEEGGSGPPHVVEALLILKHGGVLTHAGRQQVFFSLHNDLDVWHRNLVTWQAGP